MTKIKKASQLAAVTVLQSDEKIITADGSGTLHRVAPEDLANVMISPINLDGIFIIYHRSVDNSPVMCRPNKWPALQSAGEIADGVAIIEGGKVLVVAPTEAESLPWSSAAIAGGATTTSDRVTALNDWNGKTNTASIVAKSTTSAVTNTTSYAAGFCNLYGRANANGRGLTAGKWWLPALGEMMMIYANMSKINYCLELISGAAKLSETGYWVSTEGSATAAWAIHLQMGYINGGNTKASGKARVRPVSSYIE